MGQAARTLTPVTLALTGRLRTHAHAAQRPTDHDGHFAPTLCFEVEVANDPKHICQAEAHFAPGQEKQCESAAKAMRKGMQVSFEVCTDRMVLHAFAVTNIAATPAAPQACTPAGAHHQEPELFN